MVHEVAFEGRSYEVIMVETDATNLSFHTIQGSTYKTFRRGLQRPELRDLVTMLVLICEALNVITRGILRQSSPSLRVKMRQEGLPPPFCDYVNTDHSPVVLVLEYMAMLLDGSAPRLRLLYGRHGSFAAWARAEPELNSALRRGVTTACLWMFVRCVTTVMRPPFTWCKLVDPRVPTEVKRSVLDYLLDAPVQSVDELFTERMRNLVVQFDLDRSVFLDNRTPWYKLLYMYAWAIFGTVAQIEFLHGRNRSRSCKAMVWAHFVSKTINMETLRSLGQMVAAMRGRSSRPRRADNDVPEQPARTRRPTDMAGCLWA